MNTFFEPFRFIFKDILWSVLYFPVWWYTVGAWNVLQMIGKELHGFARAYNLRILFRFLLTPMYGQNDIVGRLISLYVRLAHFLILSIWTLLYTIVLLIGFLLWILVPVVIVWNILFHIGVIDSLALWN